VSGVTKLITEYICRPAARRFHSGGMAMTLR